MAVRWQWSVIDAETPGRGLLAGDVVVREVGLLGLDAVRVGPPARSESASERAAPAGRIAVLVVASEAGVVVLDRRRRESERFGVRCVVLDRLPEILRDSVAWHDLRDHVVRR